MLMIFLFPPLYYACYILKIMDITKPCYNYYYSPTTTTDHIWFITTVDGGDWWWMMAQFINALKIIETTVAVMT